MAESEFLSECRRLIDTYSKGLGLCCEIQSDLNDDYRNGRIPYGEWKEKTEENERRKTFFREQIDIFSDRLECLKKHWRYHDILSYKFEYLANFHYLCIMKKSRDIEVARLTSELASIQSRVAFLEGRQAGCVSREEYDAVIAERDAAMMGFTLSLTVRPAGNREQCR